MLRADPLSAVDRARIKNYDEITADVFKDVRACGFEGASLTALKKKYLATPLLVAMDRLIEADKVFVRGDVVRDVEHLDQWWAEQSGARK